MYRPHCVAASLAESATKGPDLWRLRGLLTTITANPGPAAVPRPEDGTGTGAVPMYGPDFAADPERVRRMGEASRRLAEERFDARAVDRLVIDGLLGRHG